MTKPPFRIDAQGTIIGPGMTIPAHQQHPLFPGTVMLTIDQVNQLYALGVAAGRLEVSDAQRKMSARVETEKVLLAPEDPDYPDIPK